VTRSYGKLRGPRCCIWGCKEDRGDGLFCPEHADALPEDLQVRIQWAHEEGTQIEWSAAVRAAVEYLG
jgi:hypothetical protein